MYIYKESENNPRQVEKYMNSDNVGFLDMDKVTETEPVHGWNGNYYLTEDDVPQKPLDVIWQEIRAHRDQLLAESDLMMFPDRPPVDKSTILVYRQELRDLPDTQSHVTSFDDIVWPTQPEE